MKENNWLDQFDKKTFSQRGEDGRVEKILEVIGPQNSDRWCVEFGAWDGIYNSSVYNLIKNHGYKAVLIEGSTKKYRELCQNMSPFPVIPLNAFVGFSPEDSLDHVLDKIDPSILTEKLKTQVTPRLPLNFDVLAIDIDGNDYHAWKAVTKYRPKLVVIEFNPTIPDEVSFVQEQVTHLNHGSSLKSLIQLGKEKGYELVSTTLNNAFFVDKKYFPLFEILDNSIEKLRTDKSRITYLFSGYDGTVFTEGFQKLDLHGLPLDAKNMQVIPRVLRGYDDSGAGFGRFKRVVKRIHGSLKKRGLI